MATRTIAFRLNDKNREDKEIMESLRNKEAFKPNPTKEDKSFFDKLKDLF